MCTFKREFQYIKNFVESLLANKYDNYYLIIVDQNENDEIKNGLISLYNQYLLSGRIRYYKVSFKGLSRARNFGLKLIDEETGIIAFPDDDCEYPSDLLERVIGTFQRNNLDFITGRSIDKITGVESNGKWLKKDTWLNLGNIWNCAISYTIFIKNSDKIIFDERLGIGSGTPFGSGEETDLLLRLIRDGFKGRYFRNLYVYHPNKSIEDLSRLKSYAMGMGGVFRKNLCLNISFLKAFFNLMIVRPLGGALLYFVKFNFKTCKLYFLNMIYRWKGFFIWTNSKS